jgi:long-chain fatty acid transport protein
LIKQKTFRRPSSVALLLLNERIGSSKNYRMKASKNRTFAPRNSNRNGTSHDIMADLFYLSLLVSLMATTTTSTIAGGIYRDGAGARTLALGGASVGQPDVALEALQANPAGLSTIKTPQLQFCLGAARADGKFANATNPEADIDRGFGVWPELAFAYPLRSIPVTLGLAFVPDAALGGEWNYVDAPGGIGGTTSYGFQEHRSEITALRTALGASVAITEKLSLGAGVGLVYNQNRLHAPYIFQSYPGLQGFKTLLDLKTDGFGVNGTVGLLYRPSDKVSLGLSYQTPTRIRSKGDANGNASVQLDNLFGPGVQPDFHYDAEVQNEFPQMISAGLAWQVQERVRTIFQIDWINWADSFDELEVYLNNGSNNDINVTLGTANIYDVIPLRWENQFVYRIGVEFQAAEAFVLRAGYTYGGSPVPDGTLTPMTAAIMEHKVGAGAGWKSDRYAVDIAYQYSLPASQRVGASTLQAGEYSNSRTEVQVHTIGITTSVNF